MSFGEAPVHLPVMEREVVRILSSDEVEVFLDATVGAGGHARALLESAGPRARLVGLDRDPDLLATARERLAGFGDRVRLAHRSFAEIEDVLEELGEPAICGALFDLGANSHHFDRPERGFSFLTPGPLDMRFDTTGGETAEDLVNGRSEEELAQLIHDLGDERRARRIARAIVSERPFRDTVRLAEVVRAATGGGGRTHPATRTFQALRIAVNRELDHVERGIPAAVRRLREGGRLVVISFHSGEDRLVKRLLKEEQRAGRVHPLTRKPLLPTADEIRRNPRARSARIRAVQIGNALNGDGA
ncbi:MAG: 16S rRNA (cytosine(1402)-N(4))-methyltransferase RsmH [Planctomycetota bacterium]